MSYLSTELTFSYEIVLHRINVIQKKQFHQVALSTKDYMQVLTEFNRIAITEADFRASVPGISKISIVTVKNENGKETKKTDRKLVIQLKDL